MSKLKILVAMQLRDMVDLSWVKSGKKTLRVIILSLLKFIVIAGISYALLFVLQKVGVFFYSESPKVMILLLSIILILSILSCTNALMKNLYFSEDNKVLITFPVSGNRIFISKLIVFYIYEIKRNFEFLFPLVFSCELLLFTSKLCSVAIFFWSIIPLLLMVMLPVVIGALLSIPLMYIYRFLKKHTLTEIIFFGVLIIFGVVITVLLIGMIPENIDLINQWPYISKFIRGFLINVEHKMTIVSQLVYSLVGDAHGGSYVITWFTLIKVLILLVVNVLFIVLNFLCSRPLFFKMMAKNFEFDKNAITIKKNVRRGKRFTFINKEWVISFRSLDISLDFFTVYLIVPILILLLNKIFAAMETKTLGDIMTYAFNILLIALPLLASNGIVATMYSREGRAGYIKKTKPIFATFPLFAKLSQNIAFSVPSIFVSVAIFGSFAHIGVLSIILLSFAILFLYVGHMVYSAMLDVMNPQNEQYATTGNDISNPNETLSSITAFVLSGVFALVSYKFFSESLLTVDSTWLASLKLLLIAFVLMIGVIYLFIQRIRCYYYE